MSIPNYFPFDNDDPVSLFAHADCVEMLVRSSDWYHLAPIRRYLFNMACTSMTWADQRTERRIYFAGDWAALSMLLELSKSCAPVAADLAYRAWSDRWDVFPITHVERTGLAEDAVVAGDDPCDAADFQDAKRLDYHRPLLPPHRRKPEEGAA